MKKEKVSPSNKVKSEIGGWMLGLKLEVMVIRLNIASSVRAVCGDW